MKNAIFLFFFIATFSVSAQSSHHILTEEQNDSWITTLRESDLSKRLEMIRNRWEQDAEFHFEVAATPRKIISENRPSPKCRPLYLFNKKEEGQIIFPANPSSEKVAAVSEFLVPENVSEVKVASESIQLIFGQRGSCGVIYITVAKNGIFEEIEEILKRKE